MLNFLIEPVPFDEAAELIVGKPAVTREVFQTLLPELRARAFSMAGVYDLETVQTVRDLIADLPRGGDWNQIKRDILTTMEPFWGGSDAPGAERKAELLLRLHGFMAYGAMNARTLDDQIDIFPYRQYLTAEDDRVRDTHAALHGIVLPADSPFWKRHMPPWEWGCRCQVVGLTEDDFQDVLEEDEGRPAEKKLILDGTIRDRLENGNELVRGPTEIFDVRTARERGDEHGFEWEPSTLRMPLDRLQERYSPEYWSAWKAWANRQEIDDRGTTVWEWLEGEELSPGPVGVSPPILGTVDDLFLKDRTRHKLNNPPVKNGIEFHAHPELRSMAEHTLDVIDSVHGDGTLPIIPLSGRTSSRGNLGEFARTTLTHEAVNIGIKRSGPWPHLTIAHELGHFIDLEALGGFRQGFASETIYSSNPLWRRFFEATDNSLSIKVIRSKVPRGSMRDYFLSRREVFARAYSQWIARRSGDPTLIADLKKSRRSPNYWRQWSSEDFEPIGQALDEIFDDAGWIRPESPNKKPLTP